jgi:2-polyprenyl-6-methoxyphenol hydroxylase-like FAD-dependent oxidoreductase
MNIDHAVIIGAGMGGLSAAAALSSFAKKITVVDKDKLSGDVRKAVPQGAHIHILLRAGLNALDELLPGISAELEQRGSAKIHLGSDQQINEFGQWMPTRELDLYFLSQSRPFLEQTVRERVAKLPNIDIVENNSVLAIAFNPTKTVSIQLKNGATLASDIVVDAAGASGPIIRQMDKALDHPVEIDTFETGIFYSTVHFAKVEPWADLQENILIIPDPGQSNIGGSLLSIENKQWCVSLHGRKGTKPPQNYEEWLELAKHLPDPRIWERIKHAEPRGDIKNYQKPLSQWRRFDKHDSLPYGYIPLGDTITSFNPIYGQGMTVALGHALALKHSLEENTTDFITLRKRYIDDASLWSKEAWKRATAYDAYYTNATEKAAQLKTIRKLALAQHQKASTDADFHLKIARQSQMLLFK